MGNSTLKTLRIMMMMDNGGFQDALIYCNSIQKVTCGVEEAAALTTKHDRDCTNSAAKPSSSTSSNSFQQTLMFWKLSESTPAH